MKYSWLCLVALLPSYLLAQEITCSHPQLCNIVRELYAHQLPANIKLRSIDLVGDPHHFEPGTKELADMMSAPYFIAGPPQLHPWITPVLAHRKQAKLATLSLEIDQEMAKKYSPSSLEAVSHFWLLPELHCEYSKQISLTLKDWFASIVTNDCTDRSLDLLQVRLTNLEKKKTIILTHDALEPALVALGFKVFTLKGSHHGESIKAQTMKNLIELQKQSQVMIWVFESGIQVPASIQNLVRPQDISMVIDILGRQERPSKKPLKDFLRELIKAHSL